MAGQQAAAGRPVEPRPPSPPPANPVLGPRPPRRGQANGRAAERVTEAKAESHPAPAERQASQRTPGRGRPAENHQARRCRPEGRNATGGRPAAKPGTTAAGTAASARRRDGAEGGSTRTPEHADGCGDRQRGRSTAHNGRAHVPHAAGAVRRRGHRMCSAPPQGGRQPQCGTPPRAGRGANATNHGLPGNPSAGATRPRRKRRPGVGRPTASRRVSSWTNGRAGSTQTCGTRPPAPEAPPTGDQGVRRSTRGDRDPAGARPGAMWPTGGGRSPVAPDERATAPRRQQRGTAVTTPGRHGNNGRVRLRQGAAAPAARETGGAAIGESRAAAAARTRRKAGKRAGREKARRCSSPARGTGNSSRSRTGGSRQEKGQHRPRAGTGPGAERNRRAKRAGKSGARAAA